jgi:pyruvate ferredoxin oxidoreductase gamma subunit
LAGFEVQDAPLYGAERRGAPIFAYVRAARYPIQERGIIRRPDLVVVADDTLLAVPAAGVMTGVDEHTVVLIQSFESAQTWRERLRFSGPLVILPTPETDKHRAYINAICAGAAVCLI